MVIDKKALKDIASNYPHHVQFKTDHWRFTKWNKDEVQFKKKDILQQLEKLEEENTVKPTQEYETNNIIVTAGMNESIDRDIGVVSTELDYCSLGTSSTAESASQTDLVAEDSGGSYARQRFSTAGTRIRINQTMKFGMLWDENDVSAVPLSIKECGIHWDLSLAAKLHARVVITTFSLDAGDLFVVQINELHENGTL